MVEKEIWSLAHLGHGSTVEGGVDPSSDKSGVPYSRFGIDEKAMGKFERDYLVDRVCVITISLDMARYHLFHKTPLPIGTRQGEWIEQDLPHIIA